MLVRGFFRILLPQAIKASGGAAVPVNPTTLVHRVEERINELPLLKTEMSPNCMTEGITDNGGSGVFRRRPLNEGEMLLTQEDEKRGRQVERWNWRFLSSRESDSTETLLDSEHELAVETSCWG
jgi:hypothetical protein